MPETVTEIHLSSLLGHLRTHKAKKEVAFLRAVVRRAALLAKQDSYRGPVEVPGYSKRIYPDDPLVPPSILEKAQSEFAAQEQMLDAAKDGKLDLIGWSCSGVDLSLLDKREYVAIKLKLDLAISEISREQYERQGYDGRTCLLWDDVVQEIIKKIKAPCDETQLANYADLVCLGDLPRSNSLTIAIADLHDNGFTEQWLKRIWRKCPNEAKEGSLQKPIEGNNVSSSTQQAQAHPAVPGVVSIDGSREASIKRPPGSPLDVLEDPVTTTWVSKQINDAAGRSDALPRRFKCRGYPLVKFAGLIYCQRKDAMAMFSKLKHRLIEQTHADS